MEIILASASARRKELLSRIVKNFKIIKSGFDEESIEIKEDLSSYVMEISKGKAQSVAKISNGNFLIIGCDTIVCLDDKVLGKPKNELEARLMLKTLSGNVHKVLTGITTINTVSNKLLTDYVCTEVKFSVLDDEVIDKYVKSGEPMDKAGAYGIQGYGGIFVEEIHGCYYNVVGLPLNRLVFLLREMGVNLLKE
jgi:septum formation protein